MIKYRICRKQVLHKDLNEKDALEKMHQLKKDALQYSEELVYELEEYWVNKKKKLQWVKDKKHPNLSYQKLK